MADLYTIPEQDDWRYDGDVSLVCDSFVMSVYKSSGILGELADQIEVTEFSPRDSYQV